MPGSYTQYTSITDSSIAEIPSSSNNATDNDVGTSPPTSQSSRWAKKSVAPQPKKPAPIVVGGKTMRIVDKPADPIPGAWSVQNSKNTEASAPAVKEAKKTAAATPLVASKTAMEGSQEKAEVKTKDKKKKKKVELEPSQAKVQEAPVTTRKKSEKKKVGPASKSVKVTPSSQQAMVDQEQPEKVPVGASKPSPKEVLSGNAVDSAKLATMPDDASSADSLTDALQGKEASQTSDKHNTYTSSDTIANDQQPGTALTQKEKRNQKSNAQRKKRAARKQADAQAAAEKAAKEAAMLASEASSLVNTQIRKIITQAKDRAWDVELGMADLELMQLSTAAQQDHLMKLAKQDFYSDMLSLYLQGVHFAPLSGEYELTSVYGQAHGSELNPEANQKIRDIMKNKLGSFPQFYQASYRMELFKRVEKMMQARTAASAKQEEEVAGQVGTMSFAFEPQASTSIGIKNETRTATTKKIGAKMATSQESSSTGSASPPAFVFSGCGSSSFTFTSKPLAAAGNTAESSATSSSSSPALFSMPASASFEFTFEPKVLHRETGTGPAHAAKDSNAPFIFGGTAIATANIAAEEAVTQQAAFHDTILEQTVAEAKTKTDIKSTASEPEDASCNSDSTAVADPELPTMKAAAVTQTPEVDESEEEIAVINDLSASPSSILIKEATADDIETSSSYIMIGSAEDVPMEDRAELATAPMQEEEDSLSTVLTPSASVDDVDPQVDADAMDELELSTGKSLADSSDVGEAPEATNATEELQAKDLLADDNLSTEVEPQVEGPCSSPSATSNDTAEEVIATLGVTHHDEAAVESHGSAPEKRLDDELPVSSGTLSEPHINEGDEHVLGSDETHRIIQASSDSESDLGHVAPEITERIPSSPAMTGNSETDSDVTLDLDPEFKAFSTPVNVGSRDAIKRDPIFDWMRNARPSVPEAHSSSVDEVSASGPSEVVPSLPAALDSPHGSPLQGEAPEEEYEVPHGRPINARRRLNTPIGITTLHEYLLALPNPAARNVSKLELIKAFQDLSVAEDDALDLGPSSVYDAVTVLANKYLQHKVFLGHIKLAVFLGKIEFGSDGKAPDYAIIRAWETCAAMDSVAEALERRFYNA